MANDNRPKYARIGFAVLSGSAAIAATLIYLGGFGGRDREVLVESYYDKPVSGLAVGSAVNFRGVKIGEVRDIILAGFKAGDLATADAQRVRILMAIDMRKVGAGERPSDDRVREVVEDYVSRGLRATVSSSGITGLSRIELNILPNPPAPATLAWLPRHPLIPPAPSLMESFSDAATRVMNQIDKMEFGGVWSNIQSVAESAARLTGGLDALVDSQRANIGAIVQSVQEASSQLGELSRRLSDNPSLLLRPADPDPLPETAEPGK